MEVVFDILDGKNTLIFFALAKPSKSPPKGERRVLKQIFFFPSENLKGSQDC